LLGYGIGDYNDKLSIKNKEEGYINLFEERYNAHNQYLSFLLIGGVLCLFSFLFMIYENIIKAIHTNNHVLVLIITLFGIVMLTENILERENGVIFFSLFLNFFGLKNYYNLD
jgi:O-antigen ligase